MCGLVGFYTTERGIGHTSRQRFMRQGLIIDTLRGDDSTGVMFHRHDVKQSDGLAGFFKDVGDGYKYTEHPKYKQLMQGVQGYRFVAGHNRAATKGSVTPENAHPFAIGHVTGMHNGTLYDTDSLIKTQEELKFTVDSKALIWNINEAGVDEVRDVILSKISGAYALVWHDGRDNSLNIARNYERSLYMAKPKDQDTIMWASEAGMLVLLNDRLDLDFEEIWEVDDYNHFKFTEGSIVPVVTEYSQDWDAYHQRFSQYPTYRSGYGGYWQSWMEEEDDRVPFDDGSGERNSASTVVRIDNGEPTSKKPAAPAPQPVYDTRVEWGGRKRGIPSSCLVDLSRLGLSPRDKIAMVPLGKVPSRNDTVVVSGHSENWDMPLLVFGMQKALADRNFDRRWTVRPIAVRQMGDKATVVCHLVSALVAENVTSPRPWSDSTTTADDEYYTYSESVSAQEWLELTAEGCAYCEIPLQLEDSDLHHWLDEDHVLCPECSDVHINAMGQE